MYFIAIVAPAPPHHNVTRCAASPPKPHINFKSRLGVHDLGNDCLMSVDGMNFCIPQKGAARKGNPFGSHKYAGKAALRYELGVDILMGNCVWIQGPYPAGAWPNIKIFLFLPRTLPRAGQTH
jgi:hypothetical protein